MALVVEDGTGKVDAESYVSVADCKSYLDARGRTAWGQLTLAAQEASLRNATDYLDAKYGLRVNGWKFNPDVQALIFPREGIVIDRVYLDPAPLPPQLIKACCEAASVASTTDLFLPLDRGGQVTEKLEIVGPITERTKWAGSAPVGTTYPAIDRWMGFLLGSSAIIGSVVRG